MTESNTKHRICNMKLNFDDLLIRHLGEFGLYQKCIFASLSLIAIGVVHHNLIHVFAVASLDHWCIPLTDSGIALKNGHNVSYALENDYVTNVTDDNRLVYRTSHNFSTGGSESVEQHELQCFASITFSNATESTGVKAYDNYPFNGEEERKDEIKIPCQKWTFDFSQYHSSVVSEWQLVCDQKWLTSFIQSLHMLGCLMGAVIFGDLSDRCGRRPVLLTLVVLQVAVGMITAFSPYLIMYAALRLLIGMVVAGLFNCAYLISVEIVGPKWRSVASIVMFFYNSAGIMILALMAFLIRDWRYLHIAIAVPTLLLLLFFWIAPESPRWLISRGKSSATKKLLLKIAKWNRTSLPDNFMEYLDAPSHKKETKSSYSILDLFRTAVMRWRTIKICIIWFSNSITYYGLCLYTSHLGGNDYVNFLLSGVVEIPAYFLCLWLLRRFGRQKPVAVCMMLAGIALICTSPFDQDLHEARVALSMVGKLFISIAYCAMYPFTAETFPTVVRNSALGVSSMWARIGGFVAPFILLLGEFNRVLPLLLCGILAFFGGLFAVLLPDTSGKSLPETIEDVENNPSYFKCVLFTLCKHKDEQRTDEDGVEEEKDPLSKEMKLNVDLPA